MPDPAPFTAWLTLLRDLGLGFTAACVVFIWLLYKGKVRWERDVIKCEKESAEWKHAALSGTGVLEKLTAVVERIESRRL